VVGGILRGVIVEIRRNKRGCVGDVDGRIMWQETALLTCQRMSNRKSLIMHIVMNISFFYNFFILST